VGWIQFRLLEEATAREQALQPMAIRPASLEPLALSAPGHVRMVNEPPAACGEEKFDFSEGIARFGDILK